MRKIEASGARDSAAVRNSKAFERSCLVIRGAPVTRSFIPSEEERLARAEECASTVLTPRCSPPLKDERSRHDGDFDYRLPVRLWLSLRHGVLEEKVGRILQRDLSGARSSVR